MRDPLQPVTELYARREQEALQRLGEARQRERKAEEDLARIRELGLDYRRERGDRGRDGITAASLKHWRGFIVQLDQGAGRQQEAVQRVRQQASRVEGAWMRARLDAAAMAKVQVRRQHTGELRRMRAEQRQQDEMAARVPSSSNASQRED
jgi:flagellar FliJ protein